MSDKPISPLRLSTPKPQGLSLACDGQMPEAADAAGDRLGTAGWED